MVEKIMAFEEGQLTEEEIPDLFQELVDRGIINHLQGFYQRIATDLALSGKIDI